MLIYETNITNEQAQLMKMAFKDLILKEIGKYR